MSTLAKLCVFAGSENSSPWKQLVQFLVIAKKLYSSNHMLQNILLLNDIEMYTQYIMTILNTSKKKRIFKPYSAPHIHEFYVQLQSSPYFDEPVCDFKKCIFSRKKIKALWKLRKTCMRATCFFNGNLFSTS